MSIDLDTVLTLIGTIVFGSLTGAMLTVWFNFKSEKNHLSMKVADHFLDNYDEIAHVLWVLEDKSELDTSINKIRKVGDWLNLVAHLKLNDSVNWELVNNLAAYKTMSAFVIKIDLCRASIGNNFEDAESWWPELYQVKREGG